MCAENAGAGKPPASIILSKKSLPWLSISGIPRARAETTNLLSTGNCFRFGDFQRRRTRAGVGARLVRWRESRRGNHKRSGPRDYGEDRARSFQKDEKSREGIAADKRGKAGIAGYAKADANDREGALARNFYDGACAPNESADRKPNGAV